MCTQGGSSLLIIIRAESRIGMYVHVDFSCKACSLFLPKYVIGVIVCVHVCLQVVNGLMEREDWESVIKVPIGMLPTGSGNALVASTLHESE